MASRPKVFAIGLPHSGSAMVAALFEGNGSAWAHHKGGALAKDLAYCAAAGTPPFAGWPDAVGFSGLYSLQKRHLPPISVGDHLAFLLAQFPDAYFIRTHRDPADWIAARFWADGGEHRQSAAWHAGVQEADLPAIWQQEDVDFANVCADVFENHPRIIDFNVTSDPIEKLCKFLNDDYRLTADVPRPDMTVTSDDIQNVLSSVEEATMPPMPRDVDVNFVQQVADFAAQKPGHNGKPKNLSGASVVWTTPDHITDRSGDPVSMIQDKNGRFLLHPDQSTFERAQGALNELAAHGAKPPLRIDMMDARFLGTDGRRHAPRQTVAYNRRAGATNLTLWPLPGYHTLAPRGAVGGFPSDKIPFENKEDRCVWLGNITGRMSPVLTPDGRDARGVYAIRNQAAKLRANSPDWGCIIADLMCVPRYNVVTTLMDHPDFEVGLVLRGAWKKLARTPAFKDVSVPKQPRTWFHKFRYILSLSGNDTGSNFLSAASSNALILKEEDGWELFYTDAFKPWVHYVPLSEGAQDAVEKLDWARANPDKSKAMADAATDLYDKFANPNNRAAFLRAIAAHLNAS